MPTYHLPAKQAVAAAAAAGYDVIGRLIEVAESAGYVIGEGGIQGYPDGSVTIDCDRDPTEDWLAWDPTIPTQAEQEAEAVRQAIQGALANLEAIVARTNQSTNLTQAEIKTGFSLVATTLGDLITYLDRLGSLGEGRG